MTLMEKQTKFSLMVARLIIFAYSTGYEITFSDAYRSEKVTYGHPQSTHRVRLAVDLNLFKDGFYLKKSEDYKNLGVYWETMGGSWGGRFDDGNHFSISHNGIR